MTTGPIPDRVTVPVAEEHITVDKRIRETGRVRVHKRVRETLQDIDEVAEAQEIVVERIPIGEWIDGPVPERHEGDTTIIPVIEEVAVVVKRLRLVEEVRVTRRRTRNRVRASIPVRREEAIVEDLHADGHGGHGGHHGDGDASDHRPVTVPATPPNTIRRQQMTTIIGLFVDADALADARDALPGGARAFGDGQDASADDLRAQLGALDVTEDDVDALAGALDKGALILAAEVEERQVTKVVSAMRKHGAKGVDTFEGRSVRLQEVEEEIEVVKKETESGVRARTKVTERPVQRTVSLTEESVEVRHREADRELSPEEAEAAFKESTVEVTAVSEEAEVRKAARLIGEVEITKTAEQRRETIRDTVRKTEVETEETGRKR